MVKNTNAALYVVLTSKAASNTHKNSIKFSKMHLNTNAALYVVLTSKAASTLTRILKNAFKYKCRPIRRFNVKGGINTYKNSAKF